MGPDTYDLVSLLRDSYVDIADRELDELIALFPGARRDGRQDRRRAEFRRRFDLMALQRNLKALGTFGYQTIARQQPVYIQYMPRTLRYARTNLAKISALRPAARAARRAHRRAAVRAGQRDTRARYLVSQSDDLTQDLCRSS